MNFDDYFKVAYHVTYASVTSNLILNSINSQKVLLPMTKHFFHHSHESIKTIVTEHFNW